MNLIETKVLALAIFLVFKILFGFLPLVVTRWWKNYIVQNGTLYNSMMGYLNCFAGGVFLGVAFFHLLPEARKEMDGVIQGASVNTQYPFTELGVMAGLFAVLFIESITLLCVGRHPDEEAFCHFHDGEDNHSPDLTRGINSSSAKTFEHYGSTGTATLNGKSSQSDTSPVHDNDSHQMTLLREDSTAGQDSKPMDGNYREDTAAERPSIEGYSRLKDAFQKAVDKEIGMASKIRIIFLFFAFSLHAVFEGLALGLQEDSFDLWALFGALVVHEAIVTFTLGMKLVETFSLRPFVCFITLFSVISPIGVGIGTVITSVQQSSLNIGLTTSILQSLATGTFLYVTFFEILNKELKNSEHYQRLRKITLIVLGCGVMALLAEFE